MYFLIAYMIYVNIKVNKEWQKSLKGGENDDSSSEGKTLSKSNDEKGAWWSMWLS